MEDRYALLIDSDNVSAKYIKPILDELSKYGNVTYKRIYGDWTKTNNAGWKGELLQNSITPIQQFSYTYGKNATDSAMIIDAMDMLYTSELIFIVFQEKPKHSVCLGSSPLLNQRKLLPDSLHMKKPLTLPQPSAIT